MIDFRGCYGEQNYSLSSHIIMYLFNLLAKQDSQSSVLLSTSLKFLVASTRVISCAVSSHFSCVFVVQLHTFKTRNITKVIEKFNLKSEQK